MLFKGNMNGVGDEMIELESSGTIFQHALAAIQSHSSVVGSWHCSLPAVALHLVHGAARRLMHVVVLVVMYVRLLSPFLQLWLFFQF